MRDAAFDPDGATPSRIAMAHVLPSCTRTHSASVIFHISGLNPAPCMAPVYTSNPALPRRPQDSVPACPLRLWPDETFTHRHSSAWHDELARLVELQALLLDLQGQALRLQRRHPQLYGATVQRRLIGRLPAYGIKGGRGFSAA